MVRRYRWPLGGALLGLVLLTLLTVSARHMTDRVAAPPAVAAAHTIGVARDDGGLHLSLSVPRGPYFRDELLPVTLVLANNSGRPIPFAGTYLLGSCQLSPLDVTMASGGQYLNPVAIDLAPQCPGFRRGPYPVLAAGKSLRVRILLGLSAGGRLALTGRAFFPPNARVVSPGLPAPSGRWDVLRHIFPGLFRSSHAPFASGWPSLTLWVRPVVPVSQMLHLVRRGHVVYVQGPRHRLPPLVAEQAAEDLEPQGACATGMTVWTPLPGNALHDLQEEGCQDSSDHEKWQVLVGAPGYAIASAVYCFNPLPSMVFGGIPGYPQQTLPRCTERVHE